MAIVFNVLFIMITSGVYMREGFSSTEVTFATFHGVLGFSAFTIWRLKARLVWLASQEGPAASDDEDKRRL